MDSTSRTILLVFVIIVLVGALVWFVWSPAGDTDDLIPNNTGTPGTPTSTPRGNGDGTSTTTAEVSTIRIALLDTEGVTTGNQRGCDRVVMTTYSVPTTTMPLTASLETLFALDREEVETGSGTWYNFIARTNDTLKFDSAHVSNGTANIFLTGAASGFAGVCDNPRAQIQIEETALQFPTVQRVQVYLNGATTELTPDLRGE